MKTKELILYESLNLFSTRGFEAVSVRDISASVGIRESALYKHYKNKQDIFDSIVNEMSNRMTNIHVELAIPLSSDYEAVSAYESISLEALQEISCRLFSFYLKDDIVSKFRKMLTIEQYRSSEIGQKFNDIFIEGTLQYQSSLFQQMIEQNLFIQGDSRIMALNFYSPIFLLLYKYDANPEKEKEAHTWIKKHIEEFSKHYAKTK